MMFMKRWSACLLALMAAAVLGCLATWWAMRQTGSMGSWIGFGRKATIDLTPEQVMHIESIGEWEVLSVSLEELVDTTRRGLLSDDHLVRIYYGTLRLGIDLAAAPDGWLRQENGRVVVTMPPVRLLDEHFVDEAATRSFHESGRWTAADREALYDQAVRQMKARGLSPQNMEEARQNARQQLQQLLYALGFEDIDIR